MIPLKDDNFYALHASGNFAKSRLRDPSCKDGSGVVQVQTHQLVITTVERATQDTLLLMKKEIEKARKLGHPFTPLDRSVVG